MIDLRCFVDDNFLCVCDIHKTSHCFEYNRNLDRCDYCLAKGRCLKGDLDTRGDYVCLCPSCHFGSICQHNMELFSFTIESLLSPDLFDASLVKRRVFLSIYIILPSVQFIYGVINNLASLMTFHRRQTRVSGVGYYLWINSLLAQISLTCLLLRIIHLIVNLRGLVIDSTMNLILCKTLPFVLSSVTRICYWLTAIVTIERVILVIYPKTQWIKKRKVIKSIIGVIIICTTASHLHEIISHTIVKDLKHGFSGK